MVLSRHVALFKVKKQLRGDPCEPHPNPNPNPNPFLWIHFTVFLSSYEFLTPPRIPRPRPNPHPLPNPTPT